MAQKPTTIVNPSRLDLTCYGKFLKNEKKIRNLASVNPNSYAAVVVRAVDHFAKGQEIMEAFFSEPHHPCYAHHNTELVAAILKEFSCSMRASELFAVWSVELRDNLKNMADVTLKDQRRRTSELDRDARVCSAILMIQTDPVEAIQFLDICRKKYPNEVFFHRMYCDLFLFTDHFDSGLKASEGVSKLFPDNSNILHTRAQLLRVTTDTGEPDYTNWARQHKQIEIVKEAYKNYLKIAPKDHRQFAENNHVLAYLSLKYSTPSSQMSCIDMQEIMLHLQNALNAELNILPCFLPFSSEAKEFVAEIVKMSPATFIYTEGNKCTIDMTTHGMPGKPKPRTVPTENIIFADMREPTERRIDVCVSHRKLLQNFFSDSTLTLLVQTDEEQNMNPNNDNNNDDSDDFEDIVLYQMTLSKKSKVFTSKVIQWTVAEDSVYSSTSGFFEMVVADTTDDVVKLRLDLGTHSPDNHTLKLLMKRFRFGTVWRLKNPDFHMDNGDEKTMYIRASPDCLISVEGQDSRKCRYCFKSITPGQHCAKCKRAAYCGKQCQTQDWKSLKHNFICCEAYNNFYN